MLPVTAFEFLRGGRNLLVSLWLLAATGATEFLFIIWLFVVRDGARPISGSPTDRVIHVATLAYPLWMGGLVALMWRFYVRRRTRAALLLATALNGFVAVLVAAVLWSLRGLKFMP